MIVGKTYDIDQENIQKKRSGVLQIDDKHNERYCVALAIDDLFEWMADIEENHKKYW